MVLTWAATSLAKRGGKPPSPRAAIAMMAALLALRIGWTTSRSRAPPPARLGDWTRGRGRGRGRGPRRGRRARRAPSPPAGRRRRARRVLPRRGREAPGPRLRPPPRGRSGSDSSNTGSARRTPRRGAPPRTHPPVTKRARVRGVARRAANPRIRSETTRVSSRVLAESTHRSPPSKGDVTSTSKVRKIMKYLLSRRALELNDVTATSAPITLLRSFVSADFAPSASFVHPEPLVRLQAPRLPRLLPSLASVLFAGRFVA